MISLHRLNGQEIVVNAELIETLEPGPQTVVHLATGNKVLVVEKADEIVSKVVEYRKAVNSSGKAVNPISGYERGKV
ncbi:MAG: flagellar FlbD family protein [Elusimicrobiota bacterium]